MQSVLNAFRVLDCQVKVSRDPLDIESASHVVLPGVGAFEHCARALSSLGFLGPLQREVLEKGKPFLGICVGLQVLARFGMEFGRHEGLGWIEGVTERLDSGQSNLRLPHMGWNEVDIRTSEPLFRGIDEGTAFYFVHSYHLLAEDQAAISSTCDYGQTVTASIQKDNLFGVQFHPEKSQSAGIRLLRNFVEVN